MMTTDFHSHILPGIDDGSQSVEMSIAMLHRMAAQGITRVVATPHFYAHLDTLEDFLARRAAAVQRLQQEMQKYVGLPQLMVGAEVYYFPGMCNAELLPTLAIEDTNSILVEMFDGPWTDGMYRDLENIHIHHGLIPIIAHVDRYITPLHQYGIPQRLSRMGVMVQANGSFFTDWRTRRLAMKLLESDSIHLLGSDCHNLSDRAPNLDRAVKMIRKKLGEEPLERIGWYERQLLGE